MKLYKIARRPELACQSLLDSPHQINCKHEELHTCFVRPAVSGSFSNGCTSGQEKRHRREGALPLRELQLPVPPLHVARHLREDPGWYTSFSTIQVIPFYLLEELKPFFSSSG